MAACGPNLTREVQTMGPCSNAKMLKKSVTFSLKSIFCINNLYILYLLLTKD